MRRPIDPNSRRRAVLALVGAVLLAACASSPVPEEVLDEEIAVERNTPLGGDALAQRKRDLERAQRDMVAFRVTLESLHERRDRSGLVLFSGFLDSYMGEHLGPLLRSEWQSRHAELAAMDAALRLAKAEVLMYMRETRRMQRELDVIEERYQGRTSMLVEYPLGRQVTLQEALELLRERKWRG